MPAKYSNTLKCALCGKPRKPTHVYCSRQCYRAFRAKTHIQLTCSNCGKVFVRLRCHIRRGTKRHFCSYRCRYQALHVAPVPRIEVLFPHIVENLVSHLTPGDKERFWSFVNKNGPLPQNRPELGPCWIWKGYINKESHYGYFYARSHGHRALGLRAHRLAWELLRGKIPRGYVTDHLCRVKKCVNVNHLEIVTPRQNTLRGLSPSSLNSRKAVCKRGHPLWGRNLYVTPKGGRRCRTCFNWLCRSYRQRKQEATST
jgi:HNH endonuclease